jgi:hypothetical protein
MSLRALNQVALDRQTKSAGLDAAVLVKALVAGRGDWDAARNVAKQWGSSGECSPRVLGALRAKAAIGTTADPRDDSDLVDISSAFLGSLVHASAFDGMLASMVRVPLPARYGSTTAGATAFIIDRGGVKPITSFAVTSDTLPALKSVGIVTLSRESARLSGPPGGLINQVIQRELTTAVASTTDTQFLSILLDAANTISASGIDARSVRRDVVNALSTITTNASSQLFVLMRSSTSKSLA